MFNPVNHPAVLGGSKTQDQVLQEFLETFQTNHYISSGQTKDFNVSLEEFTEYYQNISLGIESDQYFTTMMKNAWNLPDISAGLEPKEPTPKKQEIEPVENKEEEKKPREIMSSGKKEKEEEDNKSTSAWDTKSAYDRRVAQLSGYNVQIAGSGVKHKFGNLVAKDLPKYQNILLERFRNLLVLRGGKGVIGLERQFKIFDLNGSGQLEADEFKKAVTDYKLEIDERDLNNIFKVFDPLGKGKVNYTEFMNTLLGIMSEFRQNLVNKAFDQVDEDEDGLVTFDQLKKAFSPRFHPDVKSGKKTEEDLLNEFISTFETHHNLSNEKLEEAEDPIAKAEFVAFYNKISAAIESDAYFDAMISSVWKLGLSFNTDKQPYAGVTSKVYQVDSKACWVSDHHKGMATPQQQARPEEDRSQLSSKSGRAKGVYNPGETNKQAEQKENVYDTELLRKLKEKLKTRGIRGIIGLKRKFEVLFAVIK